jgi:methionine-rich copper-binding protein CopC
MDRSSVTLTVPLLALALVAAFASAARGHAILVDSSPRAGEATAPPGELMLRFNGRIEKRLSHVMLVGGPRKTKILLGISHPTAPPDVLRFALPPLEPGAYRAEWKVLSVDGHFTGGAVTFTVVAPGSQAPR